VIRTIETLTAAGVLLRSLREGIDYSTSTGRMLAGIFAGLAEYERELIHERAAAARHAARLRGRHTGRPPRLTPVQTRQVRSLRTGGEFITELVRTFRVSPRHDLPGPARHRVNRRRSRGCHRRGRILIKWSSRGLGGPRQARLWTSTHLRRVADAGAPPSRPRPYPSSVYEPLCARPEVHRLLRRRRSTAAGRVIDLS